MDADRESSSISNKYELERDKTDLTCKFRNYVPQTQFLDGLYVAEKTQPGSINHLISDKLELLSAGNSYRIDPKLIDPKKIDWDLKHRIEGRLEALERDTRKSISKHIKDMQKKR